MSIASKTHCNLRTLKELYRQLIDASEAEQENEFVKFLAYRTGPERWSLKTAAVLSGLADGFWRWCSKRLQLQSFDALNVYQDRLEHMFDCGAITNPEIEQLEEQLVSLWGFPESVLLDAHFFNFYRHPSFATQYPTEITAPLQLQSVRRTLLHEAHFLTDIPEARKSVQHLEHLLDQKKHSALPQALDKRLPAYLYLLTTDSSYAQQQAVTVVLLPWLLNRVMCRLHESAALDVDMHSAPLTPQKYFVAPLLSTSFLITTAVYLFLAKDFNLFRNLFYGANGLCSSSIQNLTVIINQVQKICQQLLLFLLCDAETRTPLLEALQPSFSHSEAYRKTRGRHNQPRYRVLRTGKHVLGLVWHFVTDFFADFRRPALQKQLLQRWSTASVFLQTQSGIFQAFNDSFRIQLLFNPKEVVGAYCACLIDCNFPIKPRILAKVTASATAYCLDCSEATLRRYRLLQKQQTLSLLEKEQLSKLPESVFDNLESFGAVSAEDCRKLLRAGSRSVLKSTRL